jgi:Rieske Fe-S protein
MPIPKSSLGVDPCLVDQGPDGCDDILDDAFVVHSGSSSCILNPVNDFVALDQGCQHLGTTQIEAD